MSQAEQEEAALVETAEKAERERTAELDRLYPRGEPDEEGIDLHPKDPRRWFIATCEGVTFYNAGPINRGRKGRSRRHVGSHDRRKLQPRRKERREKRSQNL